MIWSRLSGRGDQGAQAEIFYLSERCDQPATEGNFIGALLELRGNTEFDSDAESGITRSAGASSVLVNSPAHQSTSLAFIVEDALDFGLDALKHKRVNIRHVD